MEIQYTRVFDKQFRKLPLSIQEKVKERIALFIENPFEPLLGNHSLSGAKQAYRSINVTGDYRALYQELGGSIYFVAVGTHSELYG